MEADKAHRKKLDETCTSVKYSLAHNMRLGKNSHCTVKKKVMYL